MPKTKSDVVRLRHMLDAAQKALTFIQGRNRQDLDTNEQLALALVRLIEIMGEAASKVSKEVKERHQLVPWPDIIATRNKLIHAYDQVDLNMLWEIVSIDLLPLKENLQTIISIEEINEQQKLF